MGKILCATRGGEDSQRTQMAAITLAKEQGDELIFLYVADASFLDNIAAAVVVDVQAELDQMGRFQLAIAQEQAAEQGVEAQIAIRHGHLREELIKAAKELGATFVVLGSPQQETAVFEESDLYAFVAEVETQTGAQVLVVLGAD
ncbi:MAG: universal stress protein [Anaerolineae bacterium]|nr:universal stress protein [Anaerolineae bacterium]